MEQERPGHLERIQLEHAERKKQYDEHLQLVRDGELPAEEKQEAPARGPAIGHSSDDAAAIQAPAPFMAEGMIWWSFDGYEQLVFAAQTAYYGLCGLFVPAAQCRDSFPWYDDSPKGLENRRRDLARIDWRSKGPSGPSKEITSRAEILEFCQFAIAHLTSPIIRFESEIANNDPNQLLSGIGDTPLREHTPYNAAGMIEEVFRLCTLFLPIELRPKTPEGTAAHHLRGYLDDVMKACSKCEPRNLQIEYSAVPGETDADADHRLNQVVGEWKRLAAELATVPAGLQATPEAAGPVGAPPDAAGEEAVTAHGKRPSIDDLILTDKDDISRILASLGVKARVARDVLKTCEEMQPKRGRLPPRYRLSDAQAAFEKVKRFGQLASNIIGIELHKRREDRKTEGKV